MTWKLFPVPDRFKQTDRNALEKLAEKITDESLSKNTKAQIAYLLTLERVDNPTQLNLEMQKAKKYIETIITPSNANLIDIIKVTYKQWLKDNKAKSTFILWPLTTINNGIYSTITLPKIIEIDWDYYKIPFGQRQSTLMPKEFSIKNVKIDNIYAMLLKFMIDGSKGMIGSSLTQEDFEKIVSIWNGASEEEKDTCREQTNAYFLDKEKRYDCGDIKQKTQIIQNWLDMLINDINTSSLRLS